MSPSASHFERMFDNHGREVRRREFPPAGAYTSSIREGSFDLRGHRVIRLGMNVYVCILHSAWWTRTGKNYSMLMNLWVTLLCFMNLRYTVDHPEETHTSRTSSVKVRTRSVVADLQSGVTGFQFDKAERSHTFMLLPPRPSECCIRNGDSSDQAACFRSSSLCE